MSWVRRRYNYHYLVEPFGMTGCAWLDVYENGKAPFDGSLKSAMDNLRAKRWLLVSEVEEAAAQSVCDRLAEADG